MPKADLDLIKRVLQRNELEIRQVARILEEIQQEIASEVDPDKPPPVKKQFVLLVSDPNEVLKGKDLAGWVLQVPEEDSPVLAEERLIKAGLEFNTTQKGRKRPVATVGEACEALPATLLKQHMVWVKTKEPVLVLRTDNEFPTPKIGKSLRDEA